MIKIGILGYGYWGPVLVKCFEEAGCPISVIATRHPERAAQEYPGKKVLSDADALLQDPGVEAVVVALPTALHYEYVKKALLAGKHVLVEKPLTDRAGQAAELQALAVKQGRILMVDHHFIYKQAVYELKKSMEQGQLGRLYTYDSTRVNLGLVREDVDVVWDLLPHDLSLLRYFTGKDPVRVSAAGSAHLIPGKTDEAHITLFYEDAFTAHVTLSWLVPQKIRDVYVTGERGVAFYNDNEPSEKLKFCPVTFERSPQGAVLCGKGDWQVMGRDEGNALAAVAKAFLAAIRDGRPPLSDGAFGWHVVRTVEAAEASLRQGGTPVELSPAVLEEADR